jgi:hypothetical protein
MKKILLALLPLFMAVCLLPAQTSSDGFWRIEKKPNIPVSRQMELTPTHYQSLYLNLTAASQHLANAPQEATTSLRHSSLLMQLPLPDGSFAPFRLVEYAAMEAGLAAKYPQFHTYYGEGLDHPRLKVRLDLTAKGLRLMGTGPEGQWFVDPWSRQTTQHYLCYAKKDYPAPQNWSCGVDEGFMRGHDPLPPSSARAGDCQLRSYRTAIATTGEYTNYHGGVTGTLAELVNVVNRLNEIYERDLSSRLILVANNDTIIFTDPNTDPYSGGVFSNLGQNQTTLDNYIGNANYDLGHIVDRNGGGGVAFLGSLCNNSSKAGGATSLFNPTGDPFVIDYVAHEIGHQFGGNHTQNNACQRKNDAAFEPGSASTIMGYAGICPPNVQSNSDAMFHSYSIVEMYAYTLTTSCQTTIPHGNQAPTVSAGDDYIIPKQTSFFLTADAFDPDSNELSYSWEQWDNEIAPMPPSPNSGIGPAFRTFLPSDTNVRHFPNLQAIINNQTPSWERLSAVARNYHFRVTVRDNAIPGACTSEDDMVVTVDGNSGPFLVTAPNTALTWTAGQSEAVVWNVAGTDSGAVNCKTVDIFLSTDGGLTYPHILASQTLNDGNTQVQVPNLPGTQNRVRVQGHDNIFFDISNQDFTIDSLDGPALFVNLDQESRFLCAEDSFVVTITFDTVNGLTGPLDLSIMDVPSGVNVYLSNDQPSVLDTVSLLVVTDTNVASGLDTIKIVAQAPGIANVNRFFDLEISATPVAAAPTIFLPNNGAQGVALRPNFIWSPGNGNGIFELELATEPTFGPSVVFSLNNFSSNNFQFPDKLSPGKVYYWRVRTFNECGPGAYTEAQAFQTSSQVCREYHPIDTPLFLDSLGAPDVSSFVPVNDLFVVSDVNVKNLRVRHHNVGELLFTLSRDPAPEARLLSFICSGDTSLHLSFDDAGIGGLIPCPPNDSLTYQPDSALAVFDNFSSQSIWRLEVEDIFVGGGGFLEDWTLELCKDTLITGLDSLLNKPLTVLQGDSALVLPKRLQAFTPNVAKTEIAFTLLSLPKHGTLKLKGQSLLQIGDRFTQADIDAGFLSYVHDSSNVVLDDFAFSVQDGQAGWIPQATFQINVWATSLEPNLTDELRWELWPNPTSEQVSLHIHSEVPRTISYKLLNLQGQQLQNKELALVAGENQKQLNLQGLAAGVYFIRLETKGWQSIKKLVKL